MFSIVVSTMKVFRQNILGNVKIYKRYIKVYEEVRNVGAKNPCFVRKKSSSHPEIVVIVLKEWS